MRDLASRPAAKLAAFGAVLALAFAGGATVGAALPDLGPSSRPEQPVEHPVKPEPTGEPDQPAPAEPASSHETGTTAAAPATSHSAGHQQP